MTLDARVQLDYQMLVEQLPGAVYRAAPGARGTWFYINAKIEQITGVAALEIESDPERWVSLIHPEDRAAVLSQEERVAATGEPFLAEYRIVRPDDAIVWVRDEAIVLWDDAAGPVLQGVLLDITDRKQVELEMESSVSSLQATLEATADGILVVDSTGDVLWFNQEFLALWRIPDPVARAKDSDGLFVHVIEQIADPEEFIKRIEELHSDPDAEDFGVVELKDGRVYERFSIPRRVGGESEGRVWSFRDRTGQRAAAEQLRVSESRLRTIVESEPECVKLIDRDGIILEMNSAGLEMIEAENMEAIAGTCFYDLIDETDREAYAALNERIFKGERGLFSFNLTGLRGGRRRIETHAAPFLDASGEAIAQLAVSLDVTERERLHEDLHQSQKLEAVGRLAGGIAHDFNNILTVIANYANFISEELDENDTLRDDAAEIIRASNRAASLVRQLLTFSRKEVSRPRVLDFNEVIADTERLLRRTIEEDIEISVNTMDESVYVLMDPEQFEQVLLNLGLNARDAMPNGGKLTVAASLVDFDEHAIAFLPGVAVGSYACVIVGDTGEGMDDEVKSHIFEPFFTTKGRNGGTGLGLASVYGIVKQAGGHVGVESEKGRGSTFYVYLPLTEERPAAEVPLLAQHPATEGGRVAVVEDEEPVRRLVSRILERAGYEVLAVKSSLEAADLILADGNFNLLVTDVVMPEISGVELADRLTGEQPGLKVLLMSGYADVDLSCDGLADTGRSLLVKPFGKADLLTKVRELIP